MEMCRMLLESDCTKARKWGASAFVSFCDVDEEGNHERSYEAFIDIFCKFCHEDGKNKEDVKTLRLCGIQGLQGVVNKMSKTKMGERLIAQSSKKIIPSLLYNMNDSLGKTPFLLPFFIDFRRGSNWPRIPPIQSRRSHSRAPLHRCFIANRNHR